MNKKLHLFFLLSLLIFVKSNSQIMLPQMTFDPQQKGPNTIYYKFNNGIQMIEIDYNNYEKARVDLEDGINPINSVRPRHYGHNTLILRNEKGILLHQYNLRNAPFKASDFIACDKPMLTLPHLQKITSNQEAKSNYPSYGKYRYYVTENNKAGVMDTLGNPILEVRYDGIQSYSFNYKMNSYTTKYGWSTNETESNCIYTMQSNGKWGFKTDKITITPKYEELLPLKENVLRLKKANKFGLLNYKEALLLKPIYSDLLYKNDFYLYSTKVLEKDADTKILYGIINSNFKITQQPIYLNFEDIIAEYQPSGTYWTCKTEGCGAIDKNGKEISLFQYGEMPQNPYQKYYRTSAFTDSNKGYILDLDFKEIGRDYDLVYDWKNYLLMVKKGPQYGLIDLNNKVVLPCVYDAIWEESKYELGTIKKDNKYGVITNKGIVVIPCNYDNITLVDDTKIIATLLEPKENNVINRKVGLIDAQGSIIAPFKYAEIQSLGDGFYSGRMGDKYGILNKEGKEITPLKYDEIYAFRNGFCIAKIDFGFGYITKSGKELTHFYYEKPTNFNYDSNAKLFAKVVLAGKELRIDENGKSIP